MNFPQSKRAKEIMRLQHEILGKVDAISYQLSTIDGKADRIMVDTQQLLDNMAALQTTVNSSAQMLDDLQAQVTDLTNQIANLSAGAVTQDQIDGLAATAQAMNDTLTTAQA
jgi:uncharacterized protein YoxC